MKRKKFVMYPSDVQFVTGRGKRYAQRLLKTLKEQLGKKKHQLVTVDEFCQFAGLTRQQLEELLG